MRLIDLICSAVGLAITAPFWVTAGVLVWWQDSHSPVYRARRVGKNGVPFTLYKLRSMIIGADKKGGASTAGDDPRITAVGHFIRRYKLDELLQLFNVLRSEMSLVGPRPNIEPDVATYTEEEQKLLSIRPGVTDLASIVFSDEGEILKSAADPDLEYCRVIRPWKNRLALLYVEHRSVRLQLEIIALTAIAIFNKEQALVGVHKILKRLGADEKLIQVASRTSPLPAYPPPGATEVISRAAY